MEAIYRRQRVSTPPGSVEEKGVERRAKVVLITRDQVFAMESIIFCVGSVLFVFTGLEMGDIELRDINYDAKGN
ncbi:hypothetical protein L2E82_10571 [Cichorium intybus]|uniref:Uncharacterized protein n=1 Tax=Cichorium intybus TaxID=13427 RepID=A0ACB9GB17_CICIN|nr:hypothetical protein L2E82_10571 [Cichorium intybus]